MNVVLANGTMLTVSESDNVDLWWAMRGAGHNFGIVTSVTSKIYDADQHDWALTTFIYTADKVTSLFETIKEVFPTKCQNVAVLSMTAFFHMPALDPNNVGH
jgi:FAD/FMN-containing dehydrogenase